MLIDKRKLELYLENNINVLLIGKHGVGKTQVLKQVFDKAGLNWKYFSGSTLDPHINFIGVPKEVDGKLKLIRPVDFDEDNVEAIFVDEFGRSPREVRNAIMELIQFKAINGVKFPKLRVVWAATNPYDDEHTYDVDQLDPAQKDRFPIQIDVPYELDEGYFNDKYGDLAVACEWWRDLPEKIKLEVSPRRLDYALEIYKLNGDLRDVLPESSHVSKLINILNNGSIKDQIVQVVRKNSGRSWISNENNYSSAIEYIKKNKGRLDYFIPKLDSERLTSLLLSDSDVENYVTSNYIENKELQSVINPCLGNIAKTDSMKNQNIQQAIKNSIPKFVPTILEKIESNPIGLDFNSYNYVDSMRSGARPGSLSDHRRKQLNLLAKSLPKEPTSDQFNKIKEELTSYNNMSYYSTIEKNKIPYMRCLNWLAFQETKRNNISYKEAYTNLFKDHNLYCKVYASNLLQHILRDE